MIILWLPAQDMCQGKNDAEIPIYQSLQYQCAILKLGVEKIYIFLTLNCLIILFNKKYTVAPIFMPERIL